MRRSAEFATWASKSSDEQQLLGAPDVADLRGHLLDEVGENHLHHLALYLLHVVRDVQPARLVGTNLLPEQGVDALVEVEHVVPVTVVASAAVARPAAEADCLRQS